MNHAEKVGQILLKTSSNTSIVLTLEKEVFNQMPVLIQALVIQSGFSGISAAGNDWYTSLIPMIALIIIRLSLAGRPFPLERSGGTMSLILSHCSSAISCRLIMVLSMPYPPCLWVSVILSFLYILQTPSSHNRFLLL